ncbi:hypothetical protein CDAR_482451 [Caerostris darwini]|uniref:Uncharacterized protein n=1 Tax=Caerostris darwini TaxID=1538125 RepID=A0AAV4TFL7_9ARAC|nr:hypothetical protein CDAR_482451 [Caerostris darwini]
MIAHKFLELPGISAACRYFQAAVGAGRRTRAGMEELRSSSSFSGSSGEICLCLLCRSLREPEFFLWRSAARQRGAGNARWSVHLDTCLRYDCSLFAVASGRYQKPGSNKLRHYQIKLVQGLVTRVDLRIRFAHAGQLILSGDVTGEIRLRSRHRFMGRVSLT